MKILYCFFVLVFVFSLKPTFGQDRFLRKAKNAMEEGDLSKALSMISNYESKTGLTPESNFLRHLINKLPGGGIARLDDSYFQLKYAISNYHRLSPKDQQDWCEEIDFCASRFLYYQLSCDSAVFRAYQSVKHIDTISLFLSKYPQSPFVEEARILKSALAFQKALDKNTESGYQNYLNEYGKFGYADTARKLMWKVAYDQVRKLDRLESFEEFIKKYPQATQVGEAQDRVWELAWRKIDVDNRSDYLTYLSRYPESPHASEARNRVEDFDWIEARESGDIPAFEFFLAQYPQSARKEEAESILQGLIREREGMKLLAEAESGVSHLQLHQATELLNAIDPESSENIFRVRDSLFQRINYVRPLINQALGRYSTRSEGFEGIILLGVDEDSSLFCSLRVFKDGEELDEYQTNGSFAFGLSGGQLEMNWDIEEFNNTLNPLTIAQEQRKVVLKLQNGTIYRKISSDYLSEIEPTPTPVASSPASSPPSTVQSNSKPKGVVVRPSPPSIARQKYACNNTWQNFNDLTRLMEKISPDWKMYIEKKIRNEYKEQVGDVDITGANSKGIYLSTRGNSTGTTYKVLWACSGSLIVYETLNY